MLYSSIKSIISTPLYHTYPPSTESIISIPSIESIKNKKGSHL